MQSILKLIPTIEPTLLYRHGKPCKTTTNVCNWQSNVIIHTFVSVFTNANTIYTLHTLHTPTGSSLSKLRVIIQIYNVQPCSFLHCLSSVLSSSSFSSPSSLSFPYRKQHDFKHFICQTF